MSEKSRTEKIQDLTKRIQEGSRRILEVWKGLNPKLQKGVIILWMMIIGNSPFIKVIFGNEIGGYIQAGLILGAILMIIRLWNSLQKGKGKDKKGFVETHVD